MINEFVMLLRSSDEKKIKDYIFDKELEFYENDKLNSIILPKIDSQEYDKLSLVLKINDDKEPIYSITSKDKSSQNDFNVYTTNISNLFIIKKQKFTELIFANEIKKLIVMNGI